MEEQVYFKNHLDEKLAGTLHLPEKTSASGIIIGHCFTCSRHTRVLQQLSRKLTDAGFNVLRFDFSGNGQSEGTFVDMSLSKHVEEMKSAAAFVSGHTGSRWIGLAGHSMGGNIALLSAEKSENVYATCLLASRLSGSKASHFLTAAQQSELAKRGRVAFTSRGRLLEISKDFFADANRYDMAEVVRSFKKPLLIIHGDQDEIVPVDESIQAQQQNPAAITLSVIAGADHLFSLEEHRRQVAEKACDWFNELRKTQG